MPEPRRRARPAPRAARPAVAQPAPGPAIDPALRAAWRVPPALKPSQWAERYRVLPPGETDMPGPWRNDLAPYLRGIMDLPLADGVAAAFVEKASQLGISEALRNVVGYLADYEPDPVGLVLPDRAKGRKVVSERIIPLLETTARLAALLPARRALVQKELIRLANSFRLWLAWAGSPTTTKGDPWRVAIIDELDECALAVARLGQTRDLVGAAVKRTRTYGDRARLIAASTPLDLMSEIDAQVAAARWLLEFHVPCPACGGYQTLDLAHVRFDAPTPEIRADHRRWAAWILEDPDHAAYACRYCDARWHEAERAAIIRAGRWCSSTRSDPEGRTIGAAGVGPKGEPLDTDLAAGVVFDAESVAAWPHGSTLGMRIWAAYSLLGVTLSSIAAEYVLALHDRGRMFTFCTETEGRVFQQRLARVDESVFAAKRERATLDEGVVPAWAGKLLATADTQVDHFVVVLRAWGEGFCSHRVWHGVVSSFAELERLCFRTPWPCEDETCGPMVCEMLGIDTGGTTDEGADSSRTVEVYRWAQRHRARVRCLKGFESSRTGQFVWMGRGLLAEQGTSAVRRRREIALWCLAKGHWQSVLQDYVEAGCRGSKRREAEPEIWHLNRRPDARYEREMANAQHVIERSGRRPVELWKPVRPGGRWDYRDAEVYQCALASVARVDLLPPTAAIVAFRRQQYAGMLAAQAAAKAAPAGQAEPADWLNRPEGDWL